jgi:hypothetical protein
MMSSISQVLLHKSMKILDLTTDSLLLPARSQSVKVIHCQMGAAVMHSGCPRVPPRWIVLRLLLEILRARRYDWIVVPPVHVKWTVANSRSRRLLKRLMAWLTTHPKIACAVRGVLFGRQARFVVIDYSDQFEPSEFALACIEPQHYFQLNIPRDLVGRRLGPASSLIHYLPTVIQDELIDSLAMRQGAKRGHDVFVAGTYHNPQRVKQLDACRLLAKRGWKIFELGEKSFGKFTEGLLDSTLCMAGRGLAYHCFRPLEAAAAGAAPIWHEPEAGTYHDYVHGENCFLYDPSLQPDEIADFIEPLLGDPGRIAKVVDGARELLNTRHRASALASNLLRVLQQSSACEPGSLNA